MIRIVLTGPESTGKSSLSKDLANYLNVAFVPEFARKYIDHLKRPYIYEDLEIIANEQILQLQKAMSSNPENKFIIEDTDLLTIKIWSQYKYNTYPSWFDDYLLQNKPKLYFLCGIDIPWEWDHQREHPRSRKEIMELYKFELESQDLPYILIQGDQKTRLKQCIKALQLNFF